MKTQSKLSTLSRIFLIVAGIVMSFSMFLPLWEIQLYAPQYPEGLILLIYSHTLGGNVEIINGLNHYIGMQHLDPKNFPEFTFLKYLLGFWALLMIIVGIVGRRKLLNILFYSFVVFSVIAMADFYRWNHNYGHHLDPNAAIQVPGMTYDPPLIGFKQLLNFGAYSMPAKGGWCYIGAGLLILFAFIKENKAWTWLRRKKSVQAATMLMFIGLGMTACGLPEPRPVKLNEDACAHCKMTIMNPHFAAQVVSQRGRQYVFDDVACMVGFRKDHPEILFKNYYVADFCPPYQWLPVDKAMMMQSDSLRSPMGGNVAGFSNADSAHVYQAKLGAVPIAWADVNR